MKNRMIRKLSALLAAAFFLPLCVSGAQPAGALSAFPPAVSAERENKFVVGVSWQGYTSYVRRLEKILIELSHKSSHNLEFIFMDGQNNFEKQISQVESFIAHKADVILLNPSSYSDLTPAVTAANTAGIPIITIITRVRNQEKCTSYIGSDHKESAILQGMLVGRYLEGVGNLAVLEGTQGIDAQLARTEGYREILAQYPYERVIVSQPAFWERDEAYMIVENWLHNGVPIDAIMSQNDSMALGAIEAVEEAGLAGKIKVFGIDGDSDAIQAVRDGRLEGTVFMDAYGQAERFYKCLDLMFEGQKLDKEYLIPFIVVTKENINNATINRKLQ